MPKKLRLHQTGYYYKPHFDFPDPNKQYYLFTDSSNHSWIGILVQYAEWTKDNGTKIDTTPNNLLEQSFSGISKELEYFD